MLIFSLQNEKLQVEVSKTTDLSTKPLINSYFALTGKNLTVWIVCEKWSIYITVTTSSKIKTRKIPKIKIVQKPHIPMLFTQVPLLTFLFYLLYLFALVSIVFLYLCAFSNVSWLLS